MFNASDLLLTHVVHYVPGAVETVQEALWPLPPGHPSRRGAAVARREGVGRGGREGGEEGGRAAPVLPRDQPAARRARTLGGPVHHAVHLVGKYN